MTLRKLAGDTLIYGVGYILGRVLNYLLITVYLTWKFDGRQEQYGLYTEFYFYVAILLVFLTLRMETTYFRFASKGDDKSSAYQQASWLLIISAVSWTLVLLTFRHQISAFLGYPDLTTHVLILGLVLTCDILVAIPFAALRLEQRPLRFAGLKISGILVNIGSVLFFLEVLPRLSMAGALETLSYDDDSALLYVFISNLLGSLFVLLMFLRRFLTLRLEWYRQLNLKMLTYTWPLVVVGLAGVINQSGYIVLLKGVLPGELMQNLADGGIYAAATRIAVLMSLFITAFNYAAEPFFFKHAEISNSREIYAEVAKAFSIAGSLLLLVILLYLDVIGLIIGRSFRSGFHVIPILLLAFFFLGMYYNFSIWYKLTDKTRVGALISTGGSIITVGVSLILIPSIGITGSAWATFGCYGFMMVACYLTGRRFYRIDYDIKGISLIAFAAIGTFIISSIVQAQLNLGITWKLIVNSGLLAAYVVWIFRLESDLVRSVVRRS